MQTRAWINAIGIASKLVPETCYENAIQVKWCSTFQGIRRDRHSAACLGGSSRRRANLEAAMGPTRRRQICG
eukprot:8008847-Pyramimonas_sp.AAC.1